MRTSPRNYTAQGHISVEVSRVPSDWRIWETRGPDQPLPPAVAAELDRIALDSDYQELVITFTAAGYYDPGKTYGPPEKCYPPEGYEERTVDRVEIWHREPSQRKRLSPESVAAMAERFAKEIEVAALDD